VTEQQHRETVERGGGIYRALWDAKMPGIEPIVLFDSPFSRSTLGLPISRMSVEAVARQIQQSNELFKKAKEKA
jgi:hypothetical protein